MHLSLMIFFMTLGQTLWADSTLKILNGFDPVTDLISDKYEAGPYLMYDCVDGHWVCVMPSFYQDCQKLREQEVNEKKVHLSCAPIGEFPGKKACFQRQLFMVTQNHGNRFCIQDTFKVKEINF